MNLLSLASCIVVLKVLASDANGFKKCGSNFTRNHEQEMRSKQDDAVDPCKDFYNFACGNWHVSHQLRSLGARDTLTAVKAENKQLLSNYFESLETIGSSSLMGLSFGRKNLVSFYLSCQSLPTTEEKKASIYKYIDAFRINGNIPIFDNDAERSTKSDFSWEHLSAYIRRYGANSFWRTLVQPNWQNAQQLIFYIVPPQFNHLHLSKNNQFSKNEADDDSVFLYKTYVKHLFLDMGVRVRQALKYANEIVELEQKLVSLTISNVDSVVLTAPQSLRSLATEISNINLEEYFNVLLQGLDVRIDFQQKLLVAADKAYLRRLIKILNSTDSRTIWRYLLVKFLSHFEVNLHDDSLKERHEHCLEQANTFLANELSKLYMDLKHENYGFEFLDQAQHALNDIFNNVKNYFEKLINASNVFVRGIDTRAGGIQKLRSMQLKLPDLNATEREIRDDDNAFLLTENYDLNLLKLHKLHTWRELLAINSSLFAKIEHDDAQMQQENVKFMKSEVAKNYGPLNVNAYYRLKKNAIEFPVGLLALPLYDNCLQSPMVYGSIAYIVGHEVLHGFDYDGLNYDEIGNIAEGWDPKSIIAFGSKASCYLESRYSDAHANVNENIADSEGLRLALGALEMQSGQLTPTALRLFFISFAQVWCRASSAHTENHILHATHQERVNNVVGNFAEFSETFNCKATSAMNPAQKCRIW